MKFRPLHDQVVVRRIDAEEKSAGGIIIPDTAKEKPSQGEIIAVGRVRITQWPRSRKGASVSVGPAEKSPGQSDPDQG